MGAWIEIRTLRYSITNTTSHPTMGAWIEIVKTVITYIAH